MSIKVDIADRLSKLRTGILDEAKKSDKANNAAILTELFMWDTILGYADKRYDTLMKQAVNEGILKNPKDEEDAGDYVLGESKHVVVTVTVSEKARAFSPNTLANALKEKHKVPVPSALDLIEKAKIPMTVRRTVKVVER